MGMKFYTSLSKTARCLVPQLCTISSSGQRRRLPSPAHSHAGSYILEPRSSAGSW
jgi:hypothetical protein